MSILSMMPLSIAALSLTILRLTLSMTALSIMKLIMQIKMSHSVSRHCITTFEPYAECGYAMLNVVKQ